MDKEKMDELEKLCKPVREFLKSNCDPYCYVNVGWDRTTVNQSIVGIPVKDEEE